MYALIEYSQKHMYEHLHSYTCRKNTHTHKHSLVKGRAAMFPNCCSMKACNGHGSITLHTV